MNKRIETIPTETMAVLSRYHWPGNIRELENFIERAVILSRGSSLEAPLAELKRVEAETPADSTAARRRSRKPSASTSCRALSRPTGWSVGRGRRSAARHEAHDAAVEDEQARDQKDD